jgi:RND family efflux transporter MFP subunit
MTTATRRIAFLGIAVAVLGAALAAYFFAGDGRAKEARKAAPTKAGAARAVLIGTVTAQPRALEIYEDVVGSLENVMDPKIAAEVAGRVTRVLGFTGKRVKQGELLAEIDAVDFEIQQRADQAEIARLASLLEQQERVVERNRKLVSQGFISQNAIDDAIAQRNALRQQLAAARAKADATGRGLTKARVLAPIDGEIETQNVAPGDYVKVGDPLFALVGTQRMRAHLLFPESASTRIRTGLKVRLESPAAPGRAIESTIEEIKPTVSAGNRALDAIVRFETSDGAFRGGGSVNARVVLEVKNDALMVPEQSVVLRPAGKVVYVIAANRAAQRVVETGLKQDGLQEILKGLAPGEVIATDGAGFLSDGAAVTLAASRSAEAKGRDGAKKAVQ